MALTNDQRLFIYLAQSRTITPAQRRRLRHNKNALLSPTAGLHVSRIRKAYDRARVHTNRANAVEFINAMRRGMFRPAMQKRLSDQRLLAESRAQIKSVTQDVPA